MGNCLVSKFKGSYNDNTLPLYDIVVVHTQALSSVTHNSCVRMGLIADGQKVTVTGNGYFAESYAGLDDPSTRLTTLTLSGSSIKYLWFKNDDYDIHITGKYSGISSFGISVDNGSYPSLFHLSTEEFKYNSTLFRFNIYCVGGCSGDAKNVAKPTLKYAAFEETQVNVHLTDFSDCTLLEELGLKPVTDKDEIMDFVTRQVELGRTSCSGIACNYIKNAATFRGIDLEYPGSTRGHLAWDTASKVIVYLGNATLANCPKIYAYGATAEEIAAWEQAGKTVVVVD